MSATDPATGKRTAVRTVTVDAAHAGQRIDNFLMNLARGVPRSHVYRILRRGEVRVNRGRVRPTYRLREGDQVRVPPLRTSGHGEPVVPAAAGQRLEAAIVYEDRDLLVLAKPGGLPVHGGSGVAWGVIEALRAGGRPSGLELVHRLDRETSGCLLLARNRRALLTLQGHLRAGRFEPGYHALVRGRWQHGTCEIDQPLARRGGNAEIDPAGKEARTRFAPVETWPPATLLEARPLTGRTHQIRVHARHAGHPLAGDDRYGDRAFNRELRSLGLRRTFLHAHSLGFPHPVQDRWVQVEAPLPPELARVLDRLGESRR